MAGAFGAMDNAASGVGMASRWLDTIAHNISNINTYTAVGDEPFRAQFLLVEESEDGDTGGGVNLVGITEAEGDAALIYDPSHPLANEDGLVQAPLVDLTGQMSDMIIASRHYQVNTRVITTAHEAYKSALTIGR